MAMPAARVTDPSNHPGFIAGPGVPSVRIEGLPAAAAGDIHTCTMPPLAGPHPPAPIVRGSATVLIGGRPAARALDPVACGAVIVRGASSVLFG